MSSTTQRHTVNLDERDGRLLAPFLAEDSPEREVLERLTGEPMTSTSTTLAALARLGAKRVRDELLREGYDRAVAAGAFDDEISRGATDRTRARAQRRAEREDD